MSVLGFLFAGQAELPCPRAGDVNASGGLDIVDPVALLNFLFSGGPAPAAPFNECGAAPLETDGCWG